MTGPGPLTEFELITRYFSDVGPSSANNISLSIGDDCALLSLAEGQRLALSLDTLVAGRHFPIDAKPYDIARRAVAVAVSDLAAMGASPVAFTLALTLPEANEEWLQAFSCGLRESAEFYQMPLIGGDTSRGELTISIQVHGTLPLQSALLRSGAQPGDGVFVSGYLGDSAIALELLRGNLSTNAEQEKYLRSRFYCPQARIVLGQDLLPLATAAIDISDGLLADLGHICCASEVAAKINIESIPLSAGLSGLVDGDKMLSYALTGGDDYELCFTVPKERQQHLDALAKKLSLTITRIGEIVSGEGVECLDTQGTVVDFASTGYQHF